MVRVSCLKAALDWFRNEGLKASLNCSLVSAIKHCFLIELLFHSGILHRPDVLHTSFSSYMGSLTFSKSSQVTSHHILHFW